MELIETPFDDCFLIKNNIIEDKRGFLLKTYNKDFFIKSKLESNYTESLYTVTHKNIIRGMHYQNNCKLVYVTKGIILDVVVCINKQSKEFGKYFSILLSADNDLSLYIGKDYAHGFKCLEDNTITNYLLSTTYNSKDDKGIRYDSFGFGWNIKNPIVSDKDMLLPILKEL